ncbi:hypothetical protein ACWIG3_16545 [Streptomyces celluloflavus]
MLAATNDGLAAARARCETGGRPPRLTTEQIKQTQQLNSSTALRLRHLGPGDRPHFRAAPATLYRYLTPRVPKGNS